MSFRLSSCDIQNPQRLQSSQVEKVKMCIVSILFLAGVFVFTVHAITIGTVPFKSPHGCSNPGWSVFWSPQQCSPVNWHEKMISAF